MERKTGKGNKVKEDINKGTNKEGRNEEGNHMES
jgi:hypothetical protein